MSKYLTPEEELNNATQALLVAYIGAITYGWDLTLSKKNARALLSQFFTESQLQEYFAKNCDPNQ